ncbi:hypothetical protein Thiosp_02342 [Thiorhodovibrio litoralis]|nr:hypothetical protein Thiosp_02342 [Thiorhodovibrio litoralis]
MKLKQDSAIRLSATRMIRCTSALAVVAPLALAEPPLAQPSTADQRQPAQMQPAQTQAAQTQPAPTESAQTQAAQTASAQTQLAIADASVDLGILLDGVEQQCRYNDLLERFWRNLSEPEKALGVLNQELLGAIGDIQVTDEADFRMYSIPVRGTWRQVPVSQIQFGLGKGNGIHVLLVEFAAPPQQARVVFEPLVTRSKLAMSEDPDNTLDATTDLVIDGGKARLICDLST